MNHVSGFLTKVSFIVILAAVVWQLPAVAAGTSMSELRKISAVAMLPGASGTLYSAARGGIYVSTDTGKTWQLSYKTALPITMLATTNSGKLYAFVVTKGLLIFDEAAAKWDELGNEFGSQVLTHIINGAQAPVLLATDQFGQIIRSVDGGKNWQRTAGIRPPQTQAEKHGQQLFNTFCQACHGKEGTGETYTLKSLTTKDYVMAPPLNDFTHAWHHTDAAIAKTILEGSPRKNRMVAWKGVLEPQDAKDIVSYMKTLWAKWTENCQGPKHMRCM
ncbi:MAG TPA: cytochrome c [Gammaproteobacteria bacterium]|nr:cytochrome c [Gammaproteobacteria bacterium]